MNKQKRSSAKTYQTDLRIKATPHQVAAALVKGGAPRQAEKPKQVKPKEPA